LATQRMSEVLILMDSVILHSQSLLDAIFFQ
jgi:hypothetical protein